MGVVGFICWLIKVVIVCYWVVIGFERRDIGDDLLYINWDVVKFVMCCVIIVFLMGLFM